MFNPIKANDPASQVIRQNAWVGLMVKIAYVFTGARCLRGYSAFVLEQLGGWGAFEANLGSLFVGITNCCTTVRKLFRFRPCPSNPGSCFPRRQTRPAPTDSWIGGNLFPRHLFDASFYCDGSHLEGIQTTYIRNQTSLSGEL